MISFLRCLTVGIYLFAVVIESNSSNASNDFCVGDYIVESGQCAANRSVARRVCEGARDSFEANTELGRCVAFVESSCERWSDRAAGINNCKFAADRAYYRCTVSAARRLRACSLAEAKEEMGRNSGPRLGGGRG